MAQLLLVLELTWKGCVSRSVHSVFGEFLERRTHVQVRKRTRDSEMFLLHRTSSYLIRLVGSVC